MTSSNRWTRETVLDSARHFHGRAEWKAADPGAYKAAIRNGWLSEVVVHMPLRHKTWTVEALRASASRFDGRSEWKHAEPAAYASARKRGILDDLCAHMVARERPHGYWTKERVIESARRYTSVQLWDAAEASARQRAVANGWMEEATAHMSAKPLPIGPAIIHRFLMTHSIEYRSEHRFKDLPVVRAMPFDFFLPRFRLLIEYQGRQHLEGWHRDPGSRAEIQRNDRIKREWAIDAGWNYLEVKAWEDKVEAAIIARITDRLRDIAECAGEDFQLAPHELTAAQRRRLASGYAFDEETVLADAAKYQSRAAWMRGSPNIYRFALRHGLDEAAGAHMPRLVEHGKWTKAAVVASARQHETLMAWRTAEPSAYVIANRNGWLDEAAVHFDTGKKRNDYWTRERVLEDARRFKSKTEWRQASPSARGAATKHGWLAEATAHMTPGKRPNGYWTVERLVESARQHPTIEAWRKADASAVSTARRLGCMDDATPHMRELSEHRLTPDKGGVE